MEKIEFIQKGRPLVFCGYKIKPGDIKNVLLKLTDLTHALYGFSIRVIENERPRKKLIIDVELNDGFNPDKYNDSAYLYEFIARLKEVSKNFREYIKEVPAEVFPELWFHKFHEQNFFRNNYKIMSRCIF